jgi:hypothetical protein
LLYKRNTALQNTGDKILKLWNVKDIEKKKETKSEMLFLK